MEPLISLGLREPRPVYFPGERLSFEYQIDAVGPGELLACEASVLWTTMGKGDEDLGVHYFERRTPADTEDGDLRPLRQVEVILPKSPLSYCGIIVKIQWCVRVRIFLRKGKESFFEQPFQLGAVPPPELQQVRVESSSTPDEETVEQ
ncbi:MAG: hypothetical protein RIC55_15035 [Pirellulaceae bacterium]